jgi:hypothetical protein
VTDGAGLSDQAAVTVTLTDVNDAPTLGGLAHPDGAATVNQPLTLTANGVADEDSTLLKVEFYHDTNNDGVPQLGEKIGEDAGGSDGYSLTIPVAWGVGQHTYLAAVSDDQGAGSNVASVVGTVQVGQLVTFGDGSNKALMYAEADGSLVTISLKGGLATAVFTGDFIQEPAAGKKGVVVTGTNLKLVDLQITTTSGGAADLKFAVKATAGDDGRASLGDLTMTGDVKSIGGKLIDVTGDVLITGNLGKSDLGNFGAEGQTFVVEGTGTTASMKFGSIQDLQFQSAGGISSIYVAEWLVSDSGSGSGIAAPWVSKLTSGGDFQASVQLTSTNAGYSLGSMKIAGDLANAVVRAASSVKSMAANRMSGTSVLVGMSDQTPADMAPTDGSLFTNKSATLSSLKITDRTQASFVDSVIAAWSIGKASLGLVQADNGGSAFGVAANAVKSLTGSVQNGDVIPLKLSNLQGVPEVVMSEEDFNVRLVS